MSDTQTQSDNGYTINAEGAGWKVAKRESDRHPNCTGTITVKETLEPGTYWVSFWTQKDPGTADNGKARPNIRLSVGSAVAPRADNEVDV